MDSEEYLFSIIEGVQAREMESGLKALSPKEQTLFLVWSLESEINNGGFNQFFFNEAGDHSKETLSALREIGAAHTAALLQKAMAVFGAVGPNSECETRQGQVEQLTDAENDTLAELDIAFYAYTDNLSERLSQFMQSK